MSKSDKSTEKTQSSSNGADSKNSDQHWQSCVDKLNAETAAVLESIKGTSWKEADGTFTKDATKGLDMLSKAYFELSNQNAPLVYVRTSRDDLAKAIIKAKIIPNICDVLTYVYKQNLELSDSHGYYDIGIDARKILCNFALHYDEFANEIANFPGFLEFLKEYLQSKEQVRNFALLYRFLIKI